MASAGDDSNLLGPALPLALAAAALGSRGLDAGDPEGAEAIYACAARLLRQIQGPSEVAYFRLESALDEADLQTDPVDRAAILHRAFDSLLPEDVSVPIPDEPMPAVHRFIELAISIGAPAYNLGDRQGCYDVYACTARMILATLDNIDSARTRLQEALAECTTLDDSDLQAWAMRHGFDAVLGMTGASGPALAPSAIQQMLATAVSIGAPAFNYGDARGCYEVYACTARLLLHSSSVPESIKQGLGKALQEAAVIPDVARQAWILRHAFDAILDGPSSEEGAAGLEKPEDETNQ